MINKKLKITQETAEKLLGFLGFEAQLTVVEDKDNQALKIQIEAPEAGFLIGYHGEVIAALQTLLGILINKQLGQWTRVIVNIGDYREKREETLKNMALNAAQKAHFSSQPVVLDSLSALERRIIHLALKDNIDVETYSEGEGRERRLVIKPRQN